MTKVVKDRVMVVGIILIVLLNMIIPLSVNAKETSVNSGEELLDIIKNVDDEKEKKYIFEHASAKAQLEANNIIQDEINDLLSSKEFYLESDETYKTASFQTESGIEVKITLSDEKEDGKGNIVPSTKAFTGYKEYGDRRYTIDCYAQHPKGRMSLKVINRYTISDKGLVVRKPPHEYPTYMETSNTYYIKPKKTSLTYPITKASSVNKYIQINGSVYYRTTTDVGIESKKLWGLHAQTKIKLLALDKKNKRAKVDERSFIGRSEQ